MLRVEINYNISAFANIENYYEDKKKMQMKEKKTIDFTSQALKLAEKTAKLEIK